uniref:putative signal transducing protein n=1 Tax=uncultured Draconibacterium sp. TaxID=1573823 RepID=UPI003217FFE5
MQNGLVKLYTGLEIIINRIKFELESEDIKCLIKDGFKQGIEAGFGGGVPSAIDIFVTEKDFAKAGELVKAITEE